MHASGVAMRRVATNPSVTAGLKWPPEMCASAVTITAIASPCATATPISPPEPTMIAPPATKTSVKVPMNSAVPRRR